MIKPLGERVVIEVAESDVTTASGIVLPDTAKEKPQKGKVVAVGTGKLLESGSRTGSVRRWRLKSATALSSRSIRAPRSRSMTRITSLSVRVTFWRFCNR